MRVWVRRHGCGIELWSALAAVGWSKWVLYQPENLADRAPYQVLAMIASDAAWEWAGFLIGFAQLAALATEKRCARQVAAFVAASFWLCLAYGLWLANRSAPGTALYLCLGFGNMACIALMARRA